MVVPAVVDRPLITEELADIGTVSIAMPCHNHALYLVEVIESALNQNYPHLEVIVVDDGSIDDTAAVASRYGDRIKLLQQGIEDYRPRGTTALARRRLSAFCASTRTIACCPTSVS